MKRSLLILCCALLFTPVAHARYMPPPKHASVQRQVAFWTKAMHHYRYVCIEGKGRVKRSHCRALRWSRHRLSKARTALYVQSLPPHWREWLCIHRGEGAWNANTGNGYTGGLQFAPSTWSRNGGLRFAPAAYLASPLQQMIVAEAAWRESGGSFSQWPTTARNCGLL